MSIPRSLAHSLAVLLPCTLAAAQSTAAWSTTTQAAAAQSTAARSPDVLVIVLDDVACKDLALYGGPVAMPHLESLATAGVNFTRAYANPSCAPSRRSLQSGRWWCTGNGAACGPAEANTPPLSEVLLPEGMPGYASALFGKWHLGGDPNGGSWECAPLSQGYAYWYNGSAANVDECGGSSYSRWTGATAAPAGCSSRLATTYEPFDIADKFVHGWPLAVGPRLAVVNINLAHSPFHRPPAWLLPLGYKATPSSRDKFEAMIVAYDQLIGYMLTAVDLSQTLVLVVGDNGTPPNVAGADRDRAKGTTFERGVRVPLVAAGAGVVNGGRNAGDLVFIGDLWATGVELARGTASSNGVSLVPILADQAHAEPHGFVLLGNGWGTTEADRASVSSDGYKLRQRDVNNNGIPDHEEFYDLNADPDERIDLIADPTQAARIAAHRAFILASAP